MSMSEHVIGAIYKVTHAEAARLNIEMPNHHIGVSVTIAISKDGKYLVGWPGNGFFDNEINSLKVNRAYTCTSWGLTEWPSNDSWHPLIRAIIDGVIAPVEGNDMFSKGPRHDQIPEEWDRFKCILDP